MFQSDSDETHVGHRLGVGSRSERGEDQYWLPCYKLLQNTICPEIHQPSLFWTFSENQQRIYLSGKEEKLLSTSVSITMKQSTHLWNINPVTVSVHMNTTICENKAKARDHQVTH